MRKTVVISPYENNASGTLTHCIENGVMRIKLNLNINCSENHILRLYALATSRAALKPYLAEIYDGCMGSFSEACVEEKDVSGSGYSIYDFDTFVLTRYCDKSETPIGAAFLGFEWNAAKFLKKEDNEKSVLPEAPLSRAKDILGKRKGVAKNGTIDHFAQEFEQNASKYQPTHIQGGDCYNWHKIQGMSVIAELSAVRHALSGGGASNAINAAGHYIAGVCKNDFHHIAIGIPSPQGVCPMPQLADCCEYVGGYHIAGIFLANDGQYFEKYLQKCDE